MIKQCRIFHLGSLSLTNEPSRSATLKAIHTAKESGAVISYDPNYRAPIWPDQETAINEMRSGRYARLSINFYPFNKKGNKGIAVGLNNIQKWADGEPLGAVQSKAEDDFDALEDVGAADENAGTGVEVFDDSGDLPFGEDDAAGDLPFGEDDVFAA